MTTLSLGQSVLREPVAVAFCEKEVYNSGGNLRRFIFFWVFFATPLFTAPRFPRMIKKQKSTNASNSYHGKKAQVGRNSTPVSDIFHTLCFLLRAETYEEYHTFEEVMKMYRFEKGV